MDVVEGVAAPAEPSEPGEEIDELGLDCIVLVVENDHDMLYGTTQWLEQWGASVLAAQSTEEALAHVVDTGMPPDVILADYHLDGGDTGMQAIQAIRKATLTQVPAILVTADRSDALRRLSAAQDVSLMNKPVKLARLRLLIDWKARRSVDGRARLATKVGGDSTG